MFFHLLLTVSIWPFIHWFVVYCFPSFSSFIDSFIETSVIYAWVFTLSTHRSRHVIQTLGVLQHLLPFRNFCPHATAYYHSKLESESGPVKWFRFVFSFLWDMFVQMKWLLVSKLCRMLKPWGWPDDYHQDSEPSHTHVDSERFV